MLEYTGLEILFADIDRSGAAALEQIASALRRDVEDCVLTLHAGPLPYDLTTEKAANPLIEFNLHPDHSPIIARGNKKIAIALQGKVIREAKPVWFRLQGKLISISGRCSTVTNCCGSDLQLSRDLLQPVGRTVTLSYNIDIQKILKTTPSALTK